nr:hypothetical protein [Tanacetum cinerariifolium]
DLIVPAFLKELICKVLRLLVSFLGLNLFGILLDELAKGRIASSGWPFASTVPSQMTHLVASLTLDSVRSCVMQGAFLTQEKANSIPTIFSWGGSISHNGFLPSILLLVVIIVAVVVIVVVVIMVVVVVGEGWANKFHQDKASLVRVPVANFTLQSSVQLLRENTDSVCSNQRMRPTTPYVPLKSKVFAMVAACASRAATTLSATSFLITA